MGKLWKTHELSMAIASIAYVKLPEDARGYPPLPHAAGIMAHDLDTTQLGHGINHLSIYIYVYVNGDGLCLIYPQ